MIRFLGLSLLILAPVGIGFCQAHAEKCKPRILEEFMRLVAHIRFEISAFATRESELYDRFSAPALEKSGFLPVLRTYAHARDGQALLRALKEKQADLQLAPELFEKLCAYADTLGRGELTDELERAGKLEAFLSERLNDVNQKIRDRVRLFRALGLVAGIGAGLLFS